jgi:sodium-independent sulfate anion transporter 11
MSTIYLDSPLKPSYKDQVKATLMPSESWLKDAFPVLEWLPKYNRQWLYGDVICAITVGIIVIPQSMAYGKEGIVSFLLNNLTNNSTLFSC